jgi:hypothetical protein
MDANREKMIVDLIGRVLSDVRVNDRYLLTPEQHRARARQLRAWKSGSRAAELHEETARAIERRLGVFRTSPDPLLLFDPLKTA